MGAKKTQKQSVEAKRNLLKAPPSPLNTRILGVNIIALFVLGIGLLYLGHYQQALIEKELKVMQTEARLMSVALLEHGQGKPFSKNKTLHSFVEELAAQSDRRITVFSHDGELLTRSYKAPELIKKDVVNERVLAFFQAVDSVTRFLLNLTPGGDVQRLDMYPYTASNTIRDYPNAYYAFETTVPSAQAWRDRNDDIALVVASPVLKGEEIKGVVLIEKSDKDIKSAMHSLRSNILFVFLLGLLVTILFSFYLASTIANPLRILSNAADEVRRSKKRKTDIPDFSQRQDEIALLSETLRDMTEALWNRMDAVEQFAADVSHELKNPLTSLKSALETVERIKNPEKKEKLMAIIHQDINRLDRLITDISDASRIDSELSKMEMHDVDLVSLIHEVIEFYYRGTVSVHCADRLAFDNRLEQEVAFVKGVDSRLMQVFQNLIDNSFSFIPQNGCIILRLEHDNEGGFYTVYVEDNGPGIPLENLDKIFTRFYTERPETEGFGNHSGLGLSIVKQIMQAHEAEISVSNIIDEQGQVLGCRFKLVFKALK